MRYNHIKDIVSKINEQIDIVQVIGKYVQLHAKGDKFWGLSPFKSEKTPSFTVNPDKKVYYCFSTSQGGDVFNFIQKVEHVDFMGAVQMLSQELGIPLYQPSYDYDGHSNDVQKHSNDAKIIELCTRIRGTFSYFFWNHEGEEARSYIKERSFSDEILKVFHIGYAIDNPKWLYQFLSSKGYNDTQLMESGLFSKNYPQYPLFRNRLIFPICTTSGQTIAFGGRILNGDGPKYINSPETKFYRKKNTLYGLYQSKQQEGFKRLKKAYLVEGYLDVIAMHDAGIFTAVAPLGTAFTNEQGQILRRFTDSIVLVFDKDEAGVLAAIKSALICENVEFKSIKIVELSENDPADILTKYGKTELCEQLINEKDFYDYYLDYIFPGIHASMQEKEQALDSILTYCIEVKSAYKREVYIVKAADIFQVSLDLIKSEVQKKMKNLKSTHTLMNSSNDDTENSSIITKGIETITMVALCSIIDTSIETYELFRTIIRPTDLENQHARMIFSVLENLYREDSLSFNNLMDVLDDNYSRFISEHIASGEASSNAKALVDDYIVKIKIVRLKKRSKDIEYQLRVFSNNTYNILSSHENSLLQKESEYKNDKMMTNEMRINELLSEKKFINRELVRLMNVDI